MQRTLSRNATKLPLATCLVICLFASGSPLIAPAGAEHPTTNQAASDSHAGNAAEHSVDSLTVAQLRQEGSEVSTQQADATRKLAEVTSLKAPDWFINSLKYEIEQLSFLGLILTQQEVLVENRAELQTQLAAAADDPSQLVIEEIDQKPPFSFLLLEKLLDTYADAQARNSLFELEIETAIELVEQAKQEVERKNRERRRIGETLASAGDSTERVKVERQLVNVELACRICAELAELRKLGLEVKKQEQKFETRRDQALARAIAMVSANAPFTQQDLEVKLAQLARQENELRHRLTSLQAQLQQVGTLDEAAKIVSPQETLGMSSKIEHDLVRQAMSQINASLADLVILRYAWNQRFRVENGVATAAETSRLLDQLGNFQGHFSNARRVQELKLKETRLGLPQFEAGNRQEPESPHVQLTRGLLEVAESRASLLHQADRFITRFHDVLTSESRANTLKQGFANLWPVLQDWWAYEVLVVDDRPITLGKILIAVLMLLGGWLLSRHLSRMLGKRMLPRFGIHEGASLALQTIAFYTMTVICGFVTLDMLNIPLTVFTFLGGAAAIAVGFGSQNILNNFLSGLIILGEQPIRVGDLVEIDGLHANIEHIGTRSTRVRTGSNLEIIVPNSRFLENNVTNWTLSNNDIRVCVTVGVAYGSPVNDVLDLLRQAVNDEPQALNEPEPIVLFNGFGDNSLDFEVHFWVRMRTHMEGRRVQSNVRQRIDATFREADICIAFPQRDVHLDIRKPLEISLSKNEEFASLNRIRRSA